MIAAETFLLSFNCHRHYVNVSVLIKFSLKTSVFYLNYHKISMKSCCACVLGSPRNIICRGCVLESPR